ncbi:DUF3616 domain-containing protein [Desulforhopalus sp. IMCC35007]|uniref:DUF3616 domain-containing protein n=1 Tax=Desulforhopalus sp. IMCC35007 TaxID=2569543 RepID=UPI0010ADB224|nr:DUF3616 domain-containing protein [Desulforhopalus sp. IMCC35007]TKB09998.1 DUF3616 domain-containing protein [Desulforhopalus sp. IMCC35007]
MEIMVTICKVLISCTVVALMGAHLAKETIAKENKDGLVIRTFDNLYEPSAVVSLPGGHFLIFEDEGGKKMASFSLQMDDSGLLLQKIFSGGAELRVSDIEGATMGGGEQFFAVTSHSARKDGERTGERENLLRLSLGVNNSVEIHGQANLRAPLIKELLKLDPSPADKEEGLNIEGLSFTADKKTLMIGLRAPLVENKAVILLLKNPYDVGKKGFVPDFSGGQLLLDLGGGGVRAMGFAAQQGLYFFVSEIENEKGKMRSRLWSWSGERKDYPMQRDLYGLKHLRNIEGLSFFTYEEKEMVLLVCDDGNKKKKQGAHYVVVPVAQLR